MYYIDLSGKQVYLASPASKMSTMLHSYPQAYGAMCVYLFYEGYSLALDAKNIF